MAAVCTESEEHSTTEAGVVVVVAEAVPEIGKVEGLPCWRLGIQASRHAAVAVAGGDADAEDGDELAAGEEEGVDDCAAAVGAAAAVVGRDGGCPALSAGTLM